MSNRDAVPGSPQPIALISPHTARDSHPRWSVLIWNMIADGMDSGSSQTWRMITPSAGMGIGAAPLL